MQTERVTFLTTPDHKAALDAFAAENGMSTGRVVREATARYIAQGAIDDDQLQAAVIEHAEAALIEMQTDLVAIRRSIADARAAIASALADAGAGAAGVAA